MGLTIDDEEEESSPPMNLLQFLFSLLLLPLPRPRRRTTGLLSKKREKRTPDGVEREEKRSRVVPSLSFL